MAKELSKPEVNSFGQAELDKAEKKFEEFHDEMKEKAGTIAPSKRMDLSRRSDAEMQVPLSQNQIHGAKDIYLKPSKANSPLEKFNEAYREEWNFQKEYVQFVAEHREIIGEKIEMWTKPFAGVPPEFWEIPTGKPVWAPRYVAEQIKRCSYRRLKTDNAIQTGGNSNMHFHGALVVDETIHRLDAHPVSSNKSIFMGAGK